MATTMKIKFEKIIHRQQLNERTQGRIIIKNEKKKKKFREKMKKN